MSSSNECNPSRGPFTFLEFSQLVSAAFAVSDKIIKINNNINNNSIRNADGRGTGSVGHREQRPRTQPPFGSAKRKVKDLAGTTTITSASHSTDQFGRTYGTPEISNNRLRSIPLHPHNQPPHPTPAAAAPPPRQTAPSSRRSFSRNHSLLALSSSVVVTPHSSSSAAAVAAHIRPEPATSIISASASSASSAAHQDWQLPHPISQSRPCAPPNPNLNPTTRAGTTPHTSLGFRFFSAPVKPSSSPPPPFPFPASSSSPSPPTPPTPLFYCPTLSAPNNSLLLLLPRRRKQKRTGIGTGIGIGTSIGTGMFGRIKKHATALVGGGGGGGGTTSGNGNGSGSGGHSHSHAYTHAHAHAYAHGHRDDDDVNLNSHSHSHSQSHSRSYRGTHRRSRSQPRMPSSSSSHLDMDTDIELDHEHLFGGGGGGGGSSSTSKIQHPHQHTIPFISLLSSSNKNSSTSIHSSSYSSHPSLYSSSTSNFTSTSTSTTTAPNPPRRQGSRSIENEIYADEDEDEDDAESDFIPYLPLAIQYERDRARVSPYSFARAPDGSTASLLLTVQRGTTIATTTSSSGAGLSRSRSWASRSSRSSSFFSKGDDNGDDRDRDHDRGQDEEGEEEEEGREEFASSYSVTTGAASLEFLGGRHTSRPSGSSLAESLAESFDSASTATDLQGPVTPRSPGFFYNRDNSSTGGGGGGGNGGGELARASSIGISTSTSTRGRGDGGGGGAAAAATNLGPPASPRNAYDYANGLGPPRSSSSSPPPSPPSPPSPLPPRSLPPSLGHHHHPQLRHRGDYDHESIADLGPRLGVKSAHDTPVDVDEATATTAAAAVCISSSPVSAAVAVPQILPLQMRSSRQKQVQSQTQMQTQKEDSRSRGEVVSPPTMMMTMNMNMNMGVSLDDVGASGGDDSVVGHDEDPFAKGSVQIVARHRQGAGTGAIGVTGGRYDEYEYERERRRRREYYQRQQHQEQHHHHHHPYASPGLSIASASYLSSFDRNEFFGVDSSHSQQRPTAAAADFSYNNSNNNNSPGRIFNSNTNPNNQHHQQHHHHDNNNNNNTTTTTTTTTTSTTPTAISQKYEPPQRQGRGHHYHRYHPPSSPPPKGPLPVLPAPTAAKSRPSFSSSLSYLSASTSASASPWHEMNSSSVIPPPPPPLSPSLSSPSPPPQDILPIIPPLRLVASRPFEPLGPGEKQEWTVDLGPASGASIASIASESVASAVALPLPPSLLPPAAAATAAAAIPQSGNNGTATSLRERRLQSGKKKKSKTTMKDESTSASTSGTGEDREELAAASLPNGSPPSEPSERTKKNIEGPQLSWPESGTRSRTKSAPSRSRSSPRMLTRSGPVPVLPAHAQTPVRRLSPFVDPLGMVSILRFDDSDDDDNDNAEAFKWESSVSKKNVKDVVVMGLVDHRNTAADDARACAADEEEGTADWTLSLPIIKMTLPERLTFAGERRRCSSHRHETERERDRDRERDKSKSEGRRTRCQSERVVKGSEEKKKKKDKSRSPPPPKTATAEALAELHLLNRKKALDLKNLNLNLTAAPDSLSPPASPLLPVPGQWKTSPYLSRSPSPLRHVSSSSSFLKISATEMATATAAAADLAVAPRTTSPMAVLPPPVVPVDLTLHVTPSANCIPGGGGRTNATRQPQLCIDTRRVAFVGVPPLTASSVASSSAASFYRYSTAGAPSSLRIRRFSASSVDSQRSQPSSFIMANRQYLTNYQHYERPSMLSLTQSTLQPAAAHLLLLASTPEGECPPSFALGGGAASSSAGVGMGMGVGAGVGAGGTGGIMTMGKRALINAKRRRKLEEIRLREAEERSVFRNARKIRKRRKEEEEKEKGGERRGDGASPFMHADKYAAAPGKGSVDGNGNGNGSSNGIVCGSAKENAKGDRKGKKRSLGTSLSSVAGSVASGEMLSVVESAINGMSENVGDTTTDDDDGDDDDDSVLDGRGVGPGMVTTTATATAATLLLLVAPPPGDTVVLDEFGFDRPPSPSSATSIHKSLATSKSEPDLSRRKKAPWEVEMRNGEFVRQPVPRVVFWNGAGPRGRGEGADADADDKGQGQEGGITLAAGDGREEEEEEEEGGEEEDEQRSLAPRSSLGYSIDGEDVALAFATSGPGVGGLLAPATIIDAVDTTTTATTASPDLDTPTPTAITASTSMSTATPTAAAAATTLVPTTKAASLARDIVQSSIRNVFAANGRRIPKAMQRELRGHKAAAASRTLPEYVQLDLERACEMLSKYQREQEEKATREEGGEGEEKDDGTTIDLFALSHLETPGDNVHKSDMADVVRHSNAFLGVGVRVGEDDRVSQKGREYALARLTGTSAPATTPTVAITPTAAAAKENLQYQHKGKYKPDEDDDDDDGSGCDMMSVRSHASTIKLDRTQSRSPEGGEEVAVAVTMGPEVAAAAAVARRMSQFSFPLSFSRHGMYGARKMVGTWEYEDMEDGGDFASVLVMDDEDEDEDEEFLEMDGGVESSGNSIFYSARSSLSWAHLQAAGV